MFSKKPQLAIRQNKGGKMRFSKSSRQKGISIWEKYKVLHRPTMKWDEHTHKLEHANNMVSADLLALRWIWWKFSRTWCILIAVISRHCPRVGRMQVVKPKMVVALEAVPLLPPAFTQNPCNAAPPTTKLHFLISCQDWALLLQRIVLNLMVVLASQRWPGRFVWVPRYPWDHRLW